MATAPYSSVVETRWLGVAGVAVLWVGIGAGVVAGGLDLLGPLPLSRLAHHDRAGMAFGPSLIVAGLLLAGFGAEVRRRLPVAVGFTPLLMAGMAGQVVAGLVPIGEPGQSDPVHVAAALVLGGSIPLFVWRFAAGQPPGRGRRVAHGLLGAQVVATGVGIVLSQRGVAPLAEILPAITFHLWVLVVTVWPAARGSAR